MYHVGICDVHVGSCGVLIGSCGCLLRVPGVMWVAVIVWKDVWCNVQCVLRVSGVCMLWLCAEGM